MLMLLILVVAVVAGVAFGAANVISPVSTTTTASTLPATTTTIAPSNVTLSAVGDTELGNTPQLPADPTAYLAPIKAALAAPIVFGNLVPTSYAAVYRAAGFSVLNAANNHSHDFGAQGAADTTAALRAAGIAQAGLPGQIGVVREGTTRVAFVDFAPYSNTNDLLNFTAAAQLIAQAKRIANVVVVYMHAGAEGSDADHVTRTSEFYVGEDRGNPYAFAHAAIDDGADLVLASGPHVLRAMEWYRGHLIAYSLGDFANYDNFAAQGVLRLSAILHVTLSSTGSFLSGHFTSVVLSPSGQPSVDPTDASAAFVNGLSVADFGANAARISANGAVVAPAG